MGHAVSFGSGEPTHKHLDHSIFVRWDHWVGAANHKNEMDIEATATETFNHFSDVAFTEPRKVGDLHTSDWHAALRHEATHVGNDGELPSGIAGDAPSIIRHEPAHKFEVSGNNAEGDVPLESNICHLRIPFSCQGKPAH